MPTFWRNILSPSSGLLCQGREVEGLYRIRRAKAEGREPIRGKEYGKRMWTNGKPSGRLRGGMFVRKCSKRRKWYDSLLFNFIYL
jgi:hypothetical protein